MGFVRATTVDDLASRLSAAIMTGELPVGTWLRQEALAETYGVSRQPIREALRQVHASGLIEMFPNRGALVRGPSPQEIRDAYLVRAELEGLSAELAARHAPPELGERLEAAMAAFRSDDAAHVEAGPEGVPQATEAWAHANDLFHQAILDAAGVAVLARSIEALHRVVPRNLTRSAIVSVEVLADNLRQHDDVREALAAADPPASRAALQDHVLRSGALIADWFEQRQAANLVRRGQSQAVGAEILEHLG